MAERLVAIYGRRLREARENRGISQTDLGIAVRLDESSAGSRISRYENGIHQPKLGMQQLFARTLELPLAYFYAEDDKLAQLIANFGRRNKPTEKRVKTKKKSRK